MEPSLSSTSWATSDTSVPPAERIRGRAVPGGGLELPLTGLAPDPPIEAGELPEPPRPMPGDWSGPVDWRSILNGCYVFHLSGRSADAGDDPGTPERRYRDNQMCRGSIELAEYARRMLDLREQFRDIDVAPEVS